jgi:tetratricopeptide (TPR) repeat protein
MQAFIVRPFGIKGGLDFDAVDQKLIGPALKRAEIEGGTTGSILEAGNIREDMFQLLLAADLVIADISIHNANVFYELGIRHAVRARQTYMIRAKGMKPREQRGPEDEVPFDLKTDRYLEYDAADPGASLALLVQGLKEMKGSNRVDSPVFRSLPALKETERSKLSAVPADFGDEVNLAASKGQGGKLGLLAREAGRFLWEQEGRRLVGRRQFRGKFLVSARETWESVTRQEPLDPEANLILGSVHQRLGDLTQSDQCLQRVLENPVVRKEDRAEALALRGRNQKAMGRALWEDKDQAAKRASVIGKGLFVLARDSYEEGFKCNLDHFYSGLNALSLSVLLIELIGQEQEVWKETFDSDAKAAQAEEDLKTSRDQLAGAVGISLEAAEEADVNSGNPDIWLAVSKADYRFLTAKRDAAAAAAYERVAAGLQPFERGSVRDQLEMFVELNVRADRARLCLQNIGEATEPAALRQAILFTGHMIDKPDRKEPRFPASEEPRARAAIEREVRQLVEALPGPALGVAGGANGGDILFHEICASLNIPTRVLLTLPEGPFIAESVAGGGPGWIGRFNSLMASHPGKNEVQVLSGSKDLPSWMRAPAGYDVWQRTNIWLLEEALASGAPNLALIALWDGKSGDGPGGTKDLVEQARKRGVNTILLDTTARFA